MKCIAMELKDCIWEKICWLNDLSSIQIHSFVEFTTTECNIKPRKKRFSTEKSRQSKYSSTMLSLLWNTCYVGCNCARNSSSVLMNVAPIASSLIIFISDLLSTTDWNDLINSAEQGLKKEARTSKLRQNAHDVFFEVVTIKQMFTYDVFTSILHEIPIRFTPKVQEEYYSRMISFQYYRSLYCGDDIFNNNGKFFIRYLLDCLHEYECFVIFTEMVYLFSIIVLLIPWTSHQFAQYYWGICRKYIDLKTLLNYQF